MPLLGIAVNPEPGSLVIWSNEDRQGNMDIRTLHAGCKIYKGEKNIISLVSHFLDQNEAQCMAPTRYPHHPEVGRKYLKFHNIKNLFQGTKFMSEYYEFKLM